jgi:hypothetical protein
MHTGRRFPVSRFSTIALPQIGIDGISGSWILFVITLPTLKFAKPRFLADLFFSFLLIASLNLM